MVKRSILLGMILILLVAAWGCGTSGQISNLSGSPSLSAMPPEPPQPQMLEPLAFSGSAPRQKSKTAVTVDIPIAAGFSTVSFPFKNVTACSGFTHYIFKWNGSGYDPINPIVHPEQIDCHYGYWVYTPSAGSVSVTGEPNSDPNKITEINLLQGWNLVGYPDGAAQSFSDMSVRFNSTTQSFPNSASPVFVSPDPGKWFYHWIFSFASGWQRQDALPGEGGSFTPKTAYWIRSFQACQLIYGSGIPQFPPSIDILTPNHGGEGDTIVIVGSGFGENQGTSTVTFNGVNANPVSDENWFPTQIVCTVPSGAATGPVVVTVRGQASNGKIFTVGNLPAPTLISIAPHVFLPGSTVVLTGDYFGATRESSSVSFGGTSAVAIALWSNTHIICKVPGGVANGNVIVTTSGGPSNGIAYIVAPTGISGRLTKGSGLPLDVSATFTMELGGVEGAFPCFSDPVDGTYAIPTLAATYGIFNINAPGYAAGTAQGNLPAVGTVSAQGDWQMVPNGGMPPQFTILSGSPTPTPTPTPTPSPSPSPSPTPTPTPTSTPTPTPTPTGKTVAVMAGVNLYQDPGTPNLPECKPDILDTQAALSGSNMWQNGQFTVFTDTQPTKNAIRDAILSQAGTFGPNDLFLFVMSSHGTNDGTTGYLIPYDAGYSYNSLISGDELKSWLEALRKPEQTTNICVILDSCFSGSLIGKEPKNLKSKFVYTKGSVMGFKGKNPAKQLELMPDTVVITASAGDEYSYTAPELGHSLCMHYLIQGLGSGITIGPSDANLDGHITMLELYNYAYPLVVNYESTQHPQYNNGTGHEVDIK